MKIIMAILFTLYLMFTSPDFDITDTVYCEITETGVLFELEDGTEYYIGK